MCFPSLSILWDVVTVELPALRFCDERSLAVTRSQVVAVYARAFASDPLRLQVSVVRLESVTAPAHLCHRRCESPNFTPLHFTVNSAAFICRSTEHSLADCEMHVIRPGSCDQSEEELSKYIVYVKVISALPALSRSCLYFTLAHRLLRWASDPILALLSPRSHQRTCTIGIEECQV